MKKRLDWPALAIALVAGIALGTAVPVLAHVFGLNVKVASAVTGGIVASVIPLFYTIVEKKRSENQRMKRGET